MECGARFWITLNLMRRLPALPGLCWGIARGVRQGWIASRYKNNALRGWTVANAEALLTLRFELWFDN